MAYTAGHYTATYNSNALGFTDDGFTVEITHKGEPIRFEEWGDNLMDLTERGVEVTVEAVLKEWTAAGLQGLIWPWSSTFGKVDCAGRFAAAGSIGKVLVLTASSCAPAATDGPASITFHNAIIHPDVAKSINLNNKLRVVPIRMMCFLTDVGSGVMKYFTTA